MFRRDWFGALVATVVFLAGIALLLFTFKSAYEMFTTPPQQALGATTGKDLDLGKAGMSFGFVILRIFLLLVMAVVGSLIANRGVQLYAASKGHGRTEPVATHDEVARVADGAGLR